MRRANVLGLIAALCIAAAVHPPACASWYQWHRDAARTSRAAAVGPPTCPSADWQAGVGDAPVSILRTDAGRVFAVSGNTVACFDFSGNKLWQRQLGSFGETIADLTIVPDGPAIAVARSSTHCVGTFALDPADGHVMWSTQRCGTPSVSFDDAVFFAAGFSVDLLDPLTGAAGHSRTYDAYTLSDPALDPRGYFVVPDPSGWGGQSTVVLLAPGEALCTSGIGLVSPDLDVWTKLSFIGNAPMRYLYSTDPYRRIDYAERFEPSAGTPRVVAQEVQRPSGTRIALAAGRSFYYLTGLSVYRFHAATRKRPSSQRTAPDWTLSLIAQFDRAGPCDIVADAAGDCYGFVSSLHTSQPSAVVFKLSAGGAVLWRWDIAGTRVTSLIMTDDGRLILGTDDGRVIVSTRGSRLSYHVRGAVLLPSVIDPTAAVVELLDQFGVVVSQRPCDPNGRFDLGHATDANYYVRVTMPGWEFQPPVRCALDALSGTLYFVGRPAPVPGPSTTIWDVSAGAGAAGWLGVSAKLGPAGVSAAKISGTAGSGSGLRIELQKFPNGSELLRVSPYFNTTLGIEGSLAPEMDLGPMAVTPVELSQGYSLGLTSRPTFVFDKVLPEQGATDGQQQAAAVFAIAAPLTAAPTPASPAVGLLANAAVNFLGSTIGPQWAESSGAVMQIAAQTGLAVGKYGIKSSKLNTGLSIALQKLGVSYALEAAFDKYFHPGPDQPAYTSQLTLTMATDLAVLDTDLQGLNNGQEAWSLPLPALLPHAGSTGSVFLRTDLASDFQPQVVALGFSSDTQAPDSTFGTLSDVETLEVGLNVPAAKQLAAYGAGYLVEQLTGSPYGDDLRIGDWADFADELARTIVAACRYGAHHTQGPVGYFEKSIERGRGNTFNMSFGLGAGIGLDVSLEGSYYKGFTYVTDRGELWAAPLWLERHTTDGVPDEDPRNLAALVRDIFTAAWDTLSGAVSQLVSTVASAIDDGGNAVVDLTAVAGAAVASPQTRTTTAAATGPRLEISGWTARRGYYAVVDTYEPSLPRSAQTQGLLLPYTHRKVITTQAQAWTLQQVVSVGRVYRIYLKTATGAVSKFYGAGDYATLYLSVTADDLAARGISPTLLDRVVICRYDSAANRWQPLDTQQVSPTLFSAAVDTWGEYMPAIASSAVDQSPPTLLRTDINDGAALDFSKPVSFVLADQPSGLNLGLAVGGVYFTVDGQPVAAGTLELSPDGTATAYFHPQLRWCDGHEHLLRLVAADTGGHQATFGPWRFSVRPPVDFNRDDRVDQDDLAYFVTAWRQAHAPHPTVDNRCDLAPVEGAPPDIQPLPDGALDHRDAAVVLDLWLNLRSAR